MSGRCWSRPAGECRDRPPARTVRGAGSARSVVAARDAGASPFAAAVAGLGRIERTLRQCRQHRLRARTAAVRRHRRRDPGGARGHAGRCRARALHRPGPALGEPALRRGGGCLGRAARRRRRGNGTDGATPGCAAGPWRLAQAASRAGRPSRFPTTGCSSRPASRGGQDRRPRRRSARSAGHWKARSPRPAPMRGAWSRTRCSRSRPSWLRPTCGANATGEPVARPGAGHRAIRSTNSVSRPAARSPSRRPASPSITADRPGLRKVRMWRCGCFRPSPSPRSGRAGAATR